MLLDTDRFLEDSLEFTEIIDLFVLQTFPPERMPAAAADALEAGLDSRSLRQLAGADPADTEEIRKLFDRTLDELGIKKPLPVEAGLAWARRIAGDIVRGAIPPYEGARQIWGKIYVRFPQLKELIGFVAYASEYEDDASHGKDYSRLIVEEAESLSLGNTA
jgi:hypothetical protein